MGAKDVMDKVDFPFCSVAGVLVTHTRNGPPARFRFAPPMCDRFARVVVVVSTRRTEVRVAWTLGSSAPLELHPVQAASADQHTRSAFFDKASCELVVPPLSAVVFVETLLDALHQ